jgi:putative FmdB family regulatory protein
MPTYGYQCTDCQHEFQVFQNMKDDPIAACPECEGRVKRLLFPVGIVFKGSGWHINDYRTPEKTADGEGAKAETKTDSETKPASDAKPAEAKATAE